MKLRPDLESQELAFELGRWKHPDIKNALFDAFKRTPENANLAVAVSFQQLQKARPLVRRLNAKTPDNDLAKPQIMAALINLESVPKPKLADAFFSRLVARLHAKEEAFSHLRVVDALGLIQTEHAQHQLRQIISSYLKSNTGPTPPKPGTIIETTRPDQLAVESALHLRRSFSNQNLQENLLLYLKKQKAEKSLQIQMASLLPRTDTSQVTLAVEEVMGKKWQATQALLLSLKPLPVFLLPPTSLK